MNNTNNMVASALDGTKTAENLRQAFEREAANSARANIYSSIADKEGNYSAKRTFSEQSENDIRLAELWLSYLDEIGDTIENLHELSVLKDALSGDFYPLMAEIADEEGLDEIAEKLRLASSAKSAHSRILREEENRIASPAASALENPETPWLCRSCGYIVKGNAAPERCPLCSYPEAYFSKMQDVSV